MKKALSLIPALIILLAMPFCLCGCGKYSSHYNAVGFVHSNESKSAFMNFYEFEGRMVFRLKNTGGGRIDFSAKLESGDAVIYYDCGEGKKEMVSAHPSCDFKSSTPPLKSGTVYIIVETDGKCRNGGFNFEIACSGNNK